MKTDFWGTGKTYLITATFTTPKGEIFDDRRDVQRFVFWDKSEYRNKRVELSQLSGVDSIYCVETETTTILQTKEDK
ncbi:MAG: hypothetical protein KAT65_25425 [Methanophagales archaeon]|nr:hypothetical protein [Methanophagales archaeon]